MNVDLADLEAVWRERRSMRAFRPDPVPRETLIELFAAAQHAPSWCNVQPWRVAITEPPKTQALADAMQAAARSGFPRAPRVTDAAGRGPAPRPDVAFPLEYPEPYKQERIKCGAELYRNMGIAREDKAGRYDAWLRNYAFFDAPHVAVVACDRRLGPYAYIDVGLWLGFVVTAAAVLGLETCPMASVAAYPDVLRAALPIGEHDAILFGLAIGHADAAAPANRTRTTRQAVEANVTFVVG